MEMKMTMRMEEVEMGAEQEVQVTSNEAGQSLSRAG
jgi:hypothetical protein